MPYSLFFEKILTFQSNFDLINKELGIIAFHFSDGFNTTNISSLVVKQDLKILHFSAGQKSFMMLLRKNPRKSKFWQREEEDALPPPPSPASFLGQKDSGYPNCQNS